MTQHEIFTEFERLLGCYAACVKASETLSTPNGEDDEFMKMAIVGFSYHEKTEAWSRKHWLIAKEYLQESDGLEHFDSTKTKKFSMLALGALLGLYSAEMIDDRIYQIGYVTLPGFILEKGAAVEAL